MTTTWSRTPGRARPPLAGEASFAGGMLVTRLPAARVAALLPPGVALRDGPGVDGDRPLVFVFGEQSRGTWFFGGRPIPLGSRYVDFGVFVPGVAGADGVACTFVAKMCSGYFPAMWHGNVHYGFRKQVVQARWHGDAWVMTDVDGTAMAHAAIDPHEPWRAPGADDALVRDLDAWFDLPMLGRRDDGSDVVCRFTWDFGAAAVRRAAGWLAVERAFVPGLVPQTYWSAPDACHAVRGMRWGLSWPEPSTASAVRARRRG